MPAPPASVSSANTSRTSVGSTPSRAAMPPQTPARTRSRPLRSKSRVDIGSSYGADDLQLPGADGRVDDEAALRRRGIAGVMAAVALAEGVDDADLRVRGDGHSAGNDDPKVADADLRPDV